ncbi:MAG: DsbA family oxidoreductase [Crocinitomicaceae bacterium]
MKNNTIKIDIVSDVACPWCYVGKRRFEAALKVWNGAPIEVNWHPFQLDPSMQPEGMDRDTFLEHKFGGADKSSDMLNHLTSIGKEEGIEFNFGGDWLVVNTLHLHQLLHVANSEGIGVEMKERFLKAYFEESLHLNKPEVLYAILKDFGWDKEKIDTIIKDFEIAKKVKAEIAHYQKLGVSGVPYFIINDKYGMSGAQTSQVFLEAFKSVEKEVLTATAAAGETCDPETGAR